MIKGNFDASPQHDTSSSEFSVEECDWRAKSPDFNPIQHLVFEFDRGALPQSPTSLITGSSPFSQVSKSSLRNGGAYSSWLMLLVLEWDIPASHMDVLILLDMECIFILLDLSPLFCSLSRSFLCLYPDSFFSSSLCSSRWSRLFAVNLRPLV